MMLEFLLGIAFVLLVVCIVNNIRMILLLKQLKNDLGKQVFCNNRIRELRPLPYPLEDGE